jgi:1-phosphofructokinase
VTGACLLDSLRQAGLSPDFVHASPEAGPDGWTRINVKVSVVGDGERAINVPGPALPDGSFDALLDKIDHRLERNDTLVLSGSVPPGAKDDAYARILDRVAGRNIRVIADTTGPRLLAVLPYHPYLVKQNRAELEEVAGATLTDDKALVKAARNLQRQGAGHVLVSLGEEGCLLVPSFDPAPVCAWTPYPGLPGFSARHERRALSTPRWAPGMP